MVTVNGKERDAAGKSLGEYLAEAGYSAERIAVELQGEIVPKSRYNETILKNGDVLEIVSFVGGG